MNLLNRSEYILKNIRLIFILISLFLVGCTNREENSQVLSDGTSTPNSTTSNKISDSTTKYSEITIKDPIVVANGYISSENYYIQIVLKKGSYRYDYFTEQQSFWNGSYYLQIFQDNPEPPNLISEIQLEIGHEKELSFSGQFELFLDDYNNDGQSDFTLGQWIGSNRSIYQIYSIDKNGLPYILPVSISGIDQNSIFIASHSYSVELQKENDNSILYEDFDQSTGKYYSRKLKWDGTKFVF